MSGERTEASRSHRNPGAVWPTGRDLDDARRAPTLHSSDGSVDITPGPTGTDLSVSFFPLSVSVGAASWTISASAWSLPWPCVWFNSEHTIEIPFASVEGPILVQNMGPYISPESSSGNHPGQFWLRLCADVDGTASDVSGAAPLVDLMANFADGPDAADWNFLPSPMLMVPAAWFVGHADGSFTLQYSNDFQRRSNPFSSFTDMLATPWRIMQKTNNAKTFWFKCTSVPMFIYDTGGGSSSIGTFYADYKSATLPTCISRGHYLYLYPDSATTLALSSSGSPSTPPLISFTHDGLGHLLDIFIYGQTVLLTK